MRIKLVLALVLLVVAGCRSAQDGTCKKDSDCKDAVCVFGKCQECAVDSDCKDGKVCQENRCVMGAPAKQSEEVEEIEVQNEDKSNKVPDCFKSKPIHFAFDKYDIHPSDREFLTDLAACLRANESIQIRLAGNTDERGTVEYNLALGEKRAKVVFEYLQNSGINASRMTTISYGKEKPVDPEHNQAAWAKNRRTDITID